MKTKFGVAIIAVCFTWTWASTTLGQSSVLYSQFSDGQSTFGPSQLWSAAGINSEVTDDFNVIGNIDRVYAEGFIWGTVDFQGAYIRFYEYRSDGTPGVLQKEYFVNGVFNSGAIDAALSPPFAATGKHFLSVQPIINYWYWWSSQTNSPRGQAFYFRNNATAETWHHGDNLNTFTNADVSFWLYGATTGAGTISSLSATTLERSGYLEIFGSNLGDSGQVLIGGTSAPVADWTSNRIVAYIPESAPLTNVSVQVINGSGIGSNVANLNVVTRQSNGRVNWRFRMNGPYSTVRPVVAPDGTIYSIDVFGHLYALQPNGALQWLVRGAGDKGLALGPDGTIYVASEPFIRAFNPNGTEKWTFTLNPRAMITLGVGVGPDGNIYSVGTEGPGVFSLTPQGTLRWNIPEFYQRPIVDYGEIAFGPNGSNHQLYFYANNHMRAVGLDGSSVFENSVGAVSQLKPGLQPVVAPDGSVHTVLSAFAPSGSSLWSFPTPYPYNVFTPADISSNGIHYYVQNLVEMFALNPDGSQKWHRTATSNLQGPIVDPSNSLLVLGGANTGIESGFIVGASAQDGHELWRVSLPIEDPTVFNSSLGIFGFNQFVDSRARFSPDGSTAYLVTATATGDNNTSKSFVYSLNAGGTTATPTPTPSPTPVPTATPTATPSPSAGASLHSTNITLTAKVARSGVTVTGAVTVRNATGGIASAATVSASWTLPDGSTQTQSAMTNSKGIASFNVKSTRGTYTFTETNIAKSGFSFDSANSILTRSVTK
jgi:IPT/TIG domain/PQQ-like domain